MVTGMSGSAILMMIVGIIIIWGGLFLSVFYASILTKFKKKFKVEQ
ncbi:methionine/alanine import family NSS transporter small subunit [Sporosarcina sp. GW1-11]|nr:MULTISPECIES: methionine/alanine import family NSS transporter small subunit [unclassified Sporosarcina]MDV6378906.1 methionine/alanine import family NSS transporter small subunit [Sporosarcina sp. GW1-11]